jgi:hypothetical protein
VERYQGLARGLQISKAVDAGASPEVSRDLTGQAGGGSGGGGWVFYLQCQEDEYGTLVIEDSKICEVLEIDEMPDDMGLARAKGAMPARMHDMIMATAVCMIIGEWQKRKTAISVLFALIFAGAMSPANI